MDVSCLRKINTKHTPFTITIDHKKENFTYSLKIVSYIPCGIVMSRDLNDFVWLIRFLRLFFKLNQMDYPSVTIKSLQHHLRTYSFPMFYVQTLVVLTNEQKSTG